MSAIEKLEQRITALEAEVAKLKEQSKNGEPDTRPWPEKIFGTFANDPDYEEAMRLGREYRESTKPKPRQTPALSLTARAPRTCPARPKKATRSTLVTDPARLPTYTLAMRAFPLRNAGYEHLTLGGEWD